MSENVGKNPVNLVIPSRFQQVKSLPDDPENSTPYAYASSGTECFAMVVPLQGPPMPFDHPETVIDGIHQTLGNEQGLLEVTAGKTRAGRRFIYSIVKTVRTPGGAQYNLTLHLETLPSCPALQVQAFFDEKGQTGFRDAMVFELMQREGKTRVTEKGVEGWVKDPYDANYTHGILMNLSEDRRFDDLFPNHPLSELRKFVKDLLADN